MKIALIAHDGKKHELVSFVLKRLEFFQNPNLKIVATGTTGLMIERAGVQDVEKVNSGPKGGDAEIGAMVSRKELDSVIYFRVPLDKHPHDVDVSMLMRLCDVHEVPLATNYKMAHILVKHFKSKLDKDDK